MTSLLYKIAQRVGYWKARSRGTLLAARIRLAGGRCGSHLWIGRGVIFKYPVHSGYSIGERVRIGEYCTLDIPAGATLEVGNDVTFTMGVVLAACNGVKVGSNSLIGEYSSIRDADHGIALGLPIRGQAMIPAKVSIGSDVWLGRGVAVLKGATIADGAVVGANSVVVKSLPANSVSVGSPARVIRSRG